MSNDTHMKIDLDDPRLTAYVLNELPGAERKAFEAELAADPAAQLEVAALRATTSRLSAELAQEPAPELAAKHLRHLDARVLANTPVFPWFSGVAKAFAMAGAMAVVILVPIAALNTTGRNVQSLILESQSGALPTPMGPNKPVPGGPNARAVAKLDVGRNSERDRLESKLADYSQSGKIQRPVSIEEVHARVNATGYLQPAPVLTSLKDVQTRAPAPVSSVGYDRTIENDFKTAAGDPLSTFSIDVDTASYAVVRRFITQQTRPPQDAVRTEELINYFPYQYPEPDSGEPLTVLSETTECPWQPGHRLVRLGLKGRSLKAEQRPHSNLVFLVDVSGSMNGPDRLPLLIQSLRLLVDQLGENDSIAIAVYAGASGLALPATSGQDKATILRALDQLRAGGSTNGASGIQLAYQTAVSSFIKGGNNRVILATDGDFNVGVTGRGDLERLIEEKRQSGVFLSILGFGMGNHQDGTLESLSRRGNGNYAYIDTLREAQKVLVEEVGGTLVTVAKDVKIQVEFNPALVSSYRLVGYENRVMAAQDFNNDKKDAGELGAGHTVTALYEVVPVSGTRDGTGAVDPLKYQTVTSPSSSSELLTVKVRHQKPEGSPSTLLTFPVTDRGGTFESASVDTRFAASVAAFGMILRNSSHKGTATLDQVARIAGAALGPDRGGYRSEFLQLVGQARTLIKE